MLTENAIDQLFEDNQGNSILIFKRCLTCCSGPRYYGYIQGDTSDNYFAYNSQGQRLNHKGQAVFEGSLILGD